MSLIHPSIAGLSIGFTITLLCSLLLVFTTRWHGRYSLDFTRGVQKFHIKPTPRIGGLAIMLGLWLALPALPMQHQNLLLPVLIAALPAFVFGLVEDLTRSVSVRARLLATIASGVIGWHLTGVALQHIGIGPIDALLSWLPMAVLFTAFAAGGVANAVNIIDGFNGLASGTVMIGFTALGLIALGAGDTPLAQLCLLVVAVTAGFFVVNFPFGKLFLGDGGAYLLGFLLAWFSVTLVVRNPSVSVWAPLLACAYPVFETLFTIGRRLWCRRHPGLPDSWHLHSLVKSAIVAPYLRPLPAALRNACVSPVSWLLAAIPAVMAVRYPSHTPLLIATAVGSFALYLTVYALVVLLCRVRRNQAATSAPVVLAQPGVAQPGVALAGAAKTGAAVASVNAAAGVAARVSAPAAANQAEPIAEIG